MIDQRLIGLILVFAPLSLLSFGGGQAVVADIQHQTVGVQQWLSGPQFMDLFAIARAAPGPSTLIAALIGYQVSGFLGAVIATLAIFVPSSLVVYYVTLWWQNHPGSPLKTAVEHGLAPVAIGLIFAGALAVIQSAPLSVLTLATTALCTLVLYVSKVSPYLLVLGVAASFVLLGFLGFMT
jgi:chromate transporter